MTIIILSVLYLLLVVYILYSYYLDIMFLPLASFFISYFCLPGGYGEVKVSYSIALALVVALFYLYVNYWRKHTKVWQIATVNVLVSIVVVIGFALFNYYQPDLANLHEVSISASFDSTNIILYSLIVVILCPLIKTLMYKRRLINKRLKLTNKRRILKQKEAQAQAEAQYQKEAQVQTED